MTNSRVAFERAKSVTPVFLVLAGLFAVSKYSYLLFHGIAEAFSIAVAWTIFFIAWNSRRNMDNNYLLFLGIAYFFIGGLDLMHTLSYKGMGTVFPGFGANLAIQFWIGARYMESLSLLAAPVFIRRQMHPQRVLACYILITTLLFLSIFLGGFPTCFVDGVGLTSFKKNSEFIISGLLAVALAVICAKRKEFEPRVFKLVLTSIVLTICGEIVFTLYLTMFGILNVLGHFFKILSFFLIYRAIVETGLTRPMDLLFRNLKQSEERLRRSQQDLIRAQQLAHVGSWRYDVKSSEMAWSEELRNICALPAHPDESPLSMEDLRRRLHSDDLRAFDQALHDALHKCAPYSLDLRLSPHQSGALKYIRCIGDVEKDEVGGVSYLLGAIQDITDQVEAQNLREDVERIIRHNLRSPVAAFVNVPEILLEDENLTPDQQELITLVGDAGHNMLNILDETRILYQVETGKYRLDSKRVKVLEPLRKAQAEVTRLGQERNVRLEIEIDEQAMVNGGPAFYGEESLCYTMFSNLLKNAVEASPDEERVHISVTSEEDIIVEILNQGATPEDVRQRFFEKYATSGKTKGTGLGTYFSKKIVELHGGNIKLTALDNETKLTVSFPHAP